MMEKKNFFYYSEAENKIWCSGEILVADFEQKKVLFIKEDELKNRLCVPFEILCDNRAFNQYMRSHDEALVWFDQCSDSVRDARIVSTIIIRASPEEAKKAFLHICRVGTPISEEDFNKALDWNPETLKVKM